MPLYDFKCNDCSEIFTVMCKIADRDQQVCPKCGTSHYQPHHTQAPPIGDSVRLGVTKADGGFQEVLSKIHRANYGSNLADKLSRK